MNGKIKDLINQVGTDVSGKWISIDNAEKFAELIVEDACKAILEWKKEPFPFDESTAVWILKQHFGVK